jgi:hypothetical protein
VGTLTGMALNHFAADLGVRSARDALAALRAGEAVLVDVALAGHRPFVNTSGTGVYLVVPGRCRADRDARPLSGSTARGWARSVDIRAVDSQPIWLPIDGEVATAESGFAQAKHLRGLIVYRRVTGWRQTTQEEGPGTVAAPSLIPPYELDRDGPPAAERVPAPGTASSSGAHQPSEGVQGGAGASAVPKVRRTTTKATATMAAASPET